MRPIRRLSTSLYVGRRACDAYTLLPWYDCMPPKVPAELCERYGPSRRSLVMAAPKHGQSREPAGNEAKEPEPLKWLANGD
jgi:hypothetical protein